MRVMPVILVAALAACAPQGSEPAPGGGDAATAPMQAGQPYDLRGEWSVARLNGQPLDTRIPFIASSDIEAGPRRRRSCDRQDPGLTRTENVRGEISA